MNTNYTTVYEEHPSPEDVLCLQHGLDRSTPLGIPGYYPEKFSIFLKTHDKPPKVLGGLTAESLYGYVYLEMLWTAEEVRGQGLGRVLIQEAEKEARRRNCGYLWVSTFSYQAPGFYEKMGFEEFARLPEFPKGHERIFMWKKI